jgi:TonB family protein
MRPHSLLFSSDEEASRALSHALRDLEFEVETCPEIFSAVEKITKRAFDVVVCDWNEGLEALFMLKTVRELKTNHSAFTIAIADADAITAARDAGADLVVSRPIVPDAVKYSLLTCDAFLVRMKTWVPRMAPSQSIATPQTADAPLQGQAAPAGEIVRSDGQRLPSLNLQTHPEKTSQLSRGADPLPHLRAWPSPPPRRRSEGVAPMVAAESIFDDSSQYRAHAQTPQAPEPSFSSSAIPQQKRRSRILPGIAIAVAFLSVGYVFSEPLRGEGTQSSVARLCGRMLERTEAWLHTPSEDLNSKAEVQTAQNGDAESVRPGRAVSKIRITPVRDPYKIEPAAAQPTQPAVNETPLPAPVESRAPVSIPESIKGPVQTASMRSVATRIAPSLLAALEPVSLSEDFSRRLLLQKVLPSYPEQAVKAGLQGPVTLQAWIGRDGTIQDLKLVRGSFLLGQAAYRAVKQWRYQPYLINGRAVEAETFVTVDFRLP